MVGERLSDITTWWSMVLSLSAVLLRPYKLVVLASAALSSSTPHDQVPYLAEAYIS